MDKKAAEKYGKAPKWITVGAAEHPTSLSTQFKMNRINPTQYTYPDEQPDKVNARVAEKRSQRIRRPIY